MHRLLSLRRGAAALSAPAVALLPALRLRAAPQRALSAAAAAPAAPALAALLRQLRESTGAPMVDCKAALVAENNDIPRAVDWLRKKGLSAVKKAEGRAASQGLIAFAISEAGDAGALVEVRGVCAGGKRGGRDVRLQAMRRQRGHARRPCPILFSSHP
jgi:hypothetical protein